MEIRGANPRTLNLGVSQPLCNSQRMHFFVNSARQGVLCDVEIIVHLESEPEGSRILKIGGQAQGCIRSDASLAVNNLVYPARGDA